MHSWTGSKIIPKAKKQFKLPSFLSLLTNSPRYKSHIRHSFGVHCISRSTLFISFLSLFLSSSKISRPIVIGGEAFTSFLRQSSFHHHYCSSYSTSSSSSSSLTKKIFIMPMTRAAKRANDQIERKMARNDESNNDKEINHEKKPLPDEITLPDFSQFAYQGDGKSSPIQSIEADKGTRTSAISTKKTVDKKITQSSKTKQNQTKNTKSGGDDDTSIQLSTPQDPIKKREQPPSMKKKEEQASPSAQPKKRRKSPKKVKIEPGSLDPPENWEEIYSLVEELRRDKTAPVDFDGPQALAERTCSSVFRFQVLIALMLSSQTKDAVVGESIRALQKHGLDVHNINRTSPEVLNTFIQKVGFHNNKTKYIKQTSKILLEEFDGDIPETAAEMVNALPGVGPKMAYIVETLAWGTSSGIGIDTHMHRIFNQLRWVNTQYPEETRIQMEGWLPREFWGEINYLFVGFGQEVQQQPEKTLNKAVYSSRPREALALLHKLGFKIKKEAKKYGFEEEVRMIMEDGKLPINEKS